MSEITTKEMEISLNGIDLKIQVAATMEDFIKASGGDDGVDAANSSHVYRGPAGQWRDKVFPLIEEETGVERVHHMKGENKVYDETPKEYMDRLCDEDNVVEGGPFKPSDFQEIGDRIASQLSWLPTPATGRISKGFLDKAKNMLATINGNADVAAKVVANLGSQGITVTVGADGIPTERELAGAFKALHTKLAKAQAAAEAALMG